MENDQNDHPHAHDHDHSSCGISCTHPFARANSQVTNRVEESLKQTTQKIEELQQRLQRQSESHTYTSATNDATWAADWVNRYKHWQDWDWESADDIRQKLEDEKKTLERIQQRQEFTPHQHDHTIERQIFELPEREKVRLCERSRSIGNYLYSEGQFIRALEQYQLGISYYEYCFPEEEDLQKQADDIRRICLQNSAQCNLRLRRFRNAENDCNLLLQEDQNNVKALYRRALARRELGEFEKAKDDLNTALRITPEASELVLELQRLQKQKSAYDAAVVTVGRKMFQRESEEHTEAPSRFADTKLAVPGLLDSIPLDQQVSITDCAQPTVPADAFDLLLQENLQLEIAFPIDLFSAAST